MDVPWDGGGCVVLLIWALRFKKAKSCKRVVCLRLLTTRQLGGVDEAMGCRYVFRGINAPRALYRGQRQVGKGNILEKEAEGCDCLQGIQSCQFLGGGTGSDLGTLLSQSCTKSTLIAIVTFSSIPYRRCLTLVVELYDAVLEFPSTR